MLHRLGQGSGACLMHLALNLTVYILYSQLNNSYPDAGEPSLQALGFAKPDHMCTCVFMQDALPDEICLVWDLDQQPSESQFNAPTTEPPGRTFCVP